MQTNATGVPWYFVATMERRLAVHRYNYRVAIN